MKRTQHSAGCLFVRPIDAALVVVCFLRRRVFPSQRPQASTYYLVFIFDTELLLPLMYCMCPNQQQEERVICACATDIVNMEDHPP